MLAFSRTESLSNRVGFKRFFVLNLRKRLPGTFLKFDGLTLFLNDFGLSVNLVALDFSIFFFQLHYLPTLAEQKSDVKLVLSEVVAS